MNKLSILSRWLHLIRQLDKPYRYPSKKKLVESVAGQDFTAAAESTFERDVQALRTEFGLNIVFDRRRKGYYLRLPTDEDVSDFQEFVKLLERRERLELLTTAVDTVRDVARYLKLEHNPLSVGDQHLPVLWNALRGGCCVRFTYLKYKGGPPDEKPRHVVPGLLFEYRNRWYLDGYDLDKDLPRTFGLDRMQHVEPTDAVPRHAGIRQTDRRHVIGVTCPPEAEPQAVRLRFTPHQAHYVRSVPLHSSQTVVQEAGTHVDIELTVVPNPELEREILAFGEHVEVLHPESLRQAVQKRLAANLARYQADPTG